VAERSSGGTGDGPGAETPEKRSGMTGKAVDAATSESVTGATRGAVVLTTELYRTAVSLILLASRSGPSPLSSAGQGF
jgi:hypothetical protein